MGTLTPDISSSMPTPPPQASLNPQAMASLKQAQVPCLSHIPHSMLLALLMYFSVYFIYIFLQKGLSSFLT
jgi:hypothetical protein